MSMGPLFDNTLEPDDIASGTIYVLRSLPPEKPPSSYISVKTAPAVVLLTLDIGFTCLSLGIEIVERLLKPLFRRLAGVDRAANWGSRHLFTALVPKNAGPDQ